MYAMPHWREKAGLLSRMHLNGKDARNMWVQFNEWCKWWVHGLNYRNNENGWMTEWVNAYMKKWINDGMDERTNA